MAGVDSGGNVGLSGCAASGVGPNYDGARVGTREKAATRGLGNHSVLEKPRHGGGRVFIRPLIYLGLMCRLDHPHDFSGIFAIFGPFFAINRYREVRNLQRCRVSMHGNLGTIVRQLSM